MTRTGCFFVALFCSIAAPAVAQTFSFETLDGDGDGRLSRVEFANLPGFYGQPALFTELDSDGSRWITRDEWFAGPPNEAGIPQGSNASINDRGARGLPSTFSAHRRAVPPALEQRRLWDDLSSIRDELKLSGHGGATGRKRGIPLDMRPPAVATPDLDRP